MNIYQRLMEVRKAVPFLKKDNSGFQFKYVSSSQALGALREAMDANGLVLVPSVLAYEVRDHLTKDGKHNYFTILDMQFDWVNVDDPKEHISCRWTGQGLDDGEKGVGKALTYAEKYFMLKFFNIPTDKDDPDANQRRPQERQTAPKTTAQPAKPDAPKQDLATPAQIQKIQILCKEGGLDGRDLILAELSEYCKRDIKSSKDLTRAEASEWIDKHDKEAAA